MQNIHSKGTVAENMVMRALRRKMIHFSSNVTSLHGKPDIVFRHKRVVVFIDSDFWHGHPKRFVMPKSNQFYWKSKIEYNKARDKLVNSKLREQGWKVLRFWEHAIKNNLDLVVNKILLTLKNEK